MKKRKSNIARKKLTPLQLARAELKRQGRPKNEPMTLEHYIKNRLIPQLSAKKKEILHYRGRIVDVVALPDHEARLDARITVAWLLGLYPADTPIPPGLERDMELIIPDPASEPAEAETELLLLLEKIRNLE
jgi:hypothetical protein